MIRTGASLVAGGTAGLGAVVVLVLLTAVGVVQPLSLHYFPSPALQSGSARWSAPVDPTVRLVQVLRVIDGDTFEARVLLPPRRSVVTRVRLRDVDAAELKARCAREFYQALEARDALVHLLAEGEVHVFNVSPDKYPGRIDANVSTRRTADVSAALLHAGFARPYDGAHRFGWCNRDG